MGRGGIRKSSSKDSSEKDPEYSGSSKNKKSMAKSQPTNSLVLNDGNFYKIQKVRQRKILSCIPCHQRKIKCSREKPACANCHKLAGKNSAKSNEILSACTYFVNDKKKNLKKNGTSLPKEVINIHTKAKHLNSSKANALKKNKQKQQQKKHTTKSNVSESNPESEDELDYSPTPDSLSTHHSNENNFKVEIKQIYIRTENGTNTIEDVDMEDQDKGETAHGQQEFKDVDIEGEEQVGEDNEVEEEDTEDNEDEDDDFDEEEGDENEDLNEVSIQMSMNEDDLPSESQHQEPAMSREEKIKLKRVTKYLRQFEDLLTYIPTKQRSDELMVNYMKSINPLLPLIDLVSFKKCYEDFWYCGLYLKHNIEKLYYYCNYNNTQNDEEINDFLYWYNKSNFLLNPNNLLQFYQTLYVVYYASASSLCYQLPPSNMNLTKDEINQYYSVVKSFNGRMLENPKKMTLTILQLNILIQSVSNLKNGRSLTNVVKLLRICQFYQLNRDPVVYHNLNDPDVVQSRRIVWWQIFLLDNLVSFFLNLSPLIRLSEFDTSLPAEYLDGNLVSLKLNCTSLRNTTVDEEDSDHEIYSYYTSNFFNYCISFFNSQLRFSIVVNSIINLTNGLNRALKSKDINGLKDKINDLYIYCHSSRLNLDKILQNKLKNPSHQEELTFINYCNLIIQLLPDKVLIMLQKKILTTSYGSFFDSDDQTSDQMYSNTSLNLNLTLKSESKATYNYKDLTNNLLPSILHYLNLFVLLSDDSMSNFNWHLKNFIPIDELILLMTILVTNLQSATANTFKTPSSKSSTTNSPNDLSDPNSNHGSSFEESMTPESIGDLSLKIHLIGETIRILQVNWQYKLSSLNKLIGIVSDIWSLIKLKYQVELDFVLKSSEDSYIVPQPTLTFIDLSANENGHTPTATSQSQQEIHIHRSPLSEVSSPPIHHQQQQQQQQQSHQFNSQLIPGETETISHPAQSSTVSCSEIAPRTMRAVSSTYRQPFFMKSSNETSLYKLTSSLEEQNAKSLKQQLSSSVPNIQDSIGDNSVNSSDLSQGNGEAGRQNQRDTASQMSMTTQLFGNISTYRSITLSNGGEVTSLLDSDNYPGLNSQLDLNILPQKAYVSLPNSNANQDYQQQISDTKLSTPSACNSVVNTPSTMASGLSTISVEQTINKLIFDIQKECLDEYDGLKEKRGKRVIKKEAMHTGDENELGEGVHHDNDHDDEEDLEDDNGDDDDDDDEDDDDDDDDDEQEEGNKQGSGHGQGVTKHEIIDDFDEDDDFEEDVSIEDESQQGWYNLGTGEKEDLNKDDFHFYKSLKNDVTNLFKITIA